jgi:hypothetical protein
LITWLLVVAVEAAQVQAAVAVLADLELAQTIQ